MPHLRSLQINPSNRQSYPYNVDSFKYQTTLHFKQPVTFILGENGSGKSTILESIALSCQLPLLGSGGHVLNHLEPLQKQLKLIWNKRTRKGFFFRAEDFFNYLQGLRKLRSELEQDERELDLTLPEGMGKQRALGALRGEKRALLDRYGGDPLERSHGEGYLDVLNSRIQSNSLYLMDEPEAALSPTSQMALLSIMKEGINKHCQFIISTHSPILMSYPEAHYYWLNEEGLRAIDYQNISHIQLYKQFLNAPESFMRHL